MDNTQRVAGSVYTIGPQPQPPAAVEASVASALSLASLDAKLAACDTNNVRLVPGATVLIGNDAMDPVNVRGVVALDPTEPIRLPGNAAQEAGGNLAAILARTPALGTAAAGASWPVVIASDQPALPLSINAANEDGHLRAIRDTEYSLLKAALAALQYQSMMGGAFIPTQEVF